MTVSEPNRIDIILQDPDGKVVLAISETRDWSSNPQMKDELRQKVLNYIAFMKSEDYRERFGETEARVLLVSGHEPTDEIKGLLRELTESVGTDVSYKVMPTPDFF